MRDAASLVCQPGPDSRYESFAAFFVLPPRPLNPARFSASADPDRRGLRTA